MAQQLLIRHGVVMRETAIAEDITSRIPERIPRAENDGGKRLGTAWNVCGRIRRRAICDDCRRRYVAQLAIGPIKPEAVFLAATDPANPYGTLLPWPRADVLGNEILPMACRGSVERESFW